MEGGFLNSAPQNQAKRADSSTSQPTSTNGNITKATQAVPTRQSESASSPPESENLNGRLSMIPDETDISAASNPVVLREDASNILGRPLSPDAPGLYPGKTIVRPQVFDESIPPSVYLEEYWPSIHMFTLPVGGEPETAVGVYPGAAAYLKQHQGFKLPLAIREGEKASWEIKEVAGLGKALFATGDISAGDIIITERPLFVQCSLPVDFNHPSFKGLGDGGKDPNGITVLKCPPNITVDPYRIFPRTVNRLGPERRKAFFGLLDMKSEVYPGGYITKAEGILRTNGVQLALPAIVEGVTTTAVCENISRANHSCIPNAHYYFNYVNFSYELRALRPIPANTEITVTYIDPYVPRAVRQSALSRDYAFTCSCTGCTDPGADQRLVHFVQVLSIESKLIDQLCDGIKRETQGHPGVISALNGLRTLYARYTYLFSSEPIPDHAIHYRTELIKRWAHLEMIFGSDSAPVEAMKIAVEGMKVIERMEPCPSSMKYRVLDAYIKGGKAGMEASRKMTEWM